MRDMKTQCFDLNVLQLDAILLLEVSLDSSGLLAVFLSALDQNFIAIGNSNDGAWIQRYSLFEGVSSMTFLSPSLRLDTSIGVLEYGMERGRSKDTPYVRADDHWDPRYLRLSYSGSEAWLMKGSRRILWIPRQDVDPERFSIQTDLEAGKSTVTLVHDGCLFILTIETDSI